jgi:hypothetical protein
MALSFKNIWNRLVVAATALMTQFSGFVAIPPAGEQWFNFGRFLVAVAIGLWTVPFVGFDKKRHQLPWFALTVALVVPATAGVLHYNSLLDRWSVEYFQQERIVVGGTMTDDARQYRDQLLKANQPTDDLTVLRKYGGNAAAVWLPGEIARRSESLTRWYLATLFMLASVVVCLAQTIFCSKRR